MTPERIEEIASTFTRLSCGAADWRHRELLTAARELASAQKTIAELRDALVKIRDNAFAISAGLPTSTENIIEMVTKALSAKGPDDQS